MTCFGHDFKSSQLKLFIFVIVPCQASGCRLPHKLATTMVTSTSGKTVTCMTAAVTHLDYIDTMIRVIVLTYIWL